MDYIYLHGFASGPGSYKGQWLTSRFQQQQLCLALPDLNQGDFYHLTLTRQIHQIGKLMAGPTTLIGSSLGGLVAAWVSQHYLQVERLVLLAPAFRFLEQWLPKLTPDQRHQWQYGPGLSVYHYGLQQQTRLGHGFLTDLQQYSDTQLTRPVPTHILHGRWDEVIALSSSQQYASQRPWVTLETLETDHAMASAMESIWQRIVALCDLQPT